MEYYTVLDTILDILNIIELTFYSICSILCVYLIYYTFNYIHSYFTIETKPLKQKKTEHIFNSIELFDPTMELDNFQFTHIIHFNSNVYLDDELVSNINTYIDLFQQHKSILYKNLPMLSDLTIHLHPSQDIHDRKVYICFKLTTIYQKGFSTEFILEFKTKAKQYIQSLEYVFSSFNVVIQ